MEDFSQYNADGTSLRKIQLRLVEMLVEIDKICRKHNIQYWIDYGTLLGAVRHGGFIPWDDDLDISIPSADLKRFLEIAPKELPDSLFLQSKKTDPTWRRDIIRIRDNNSLFITDSDDFSRDYHKGLFIDIFEILPYPIINKKAERFILHWYLKTKRFFSTKQDMTLKNIVAAITFPIVSTSLGFFWKILNIGPKKNRIGYKPSISAYGNSYAIDMVFPLRDIQFEGLSFLGPTNPDHYLTSIYGDYMKIPPKEKRRTHIVHVEFFD